MVGDSESSARAQSLGFLQEAAEAEGAEDSESFVHAQILGFPEEAVVVEVVFL